MFLDAANELFSRARLRVYGTETKSFTKTDFKNKKNFKKYNKGFMGVFLKQLKNKNFNLNSFIRNGHKNNRRKSKIKSAQRGFRRTWQ
jgi:hypothetical protein